MTVFHGSYIEIIAPDLDHSRRNVDFGPGFYTTPLHEQAEKWCGRFTARYGHAVISAYELDEYALSKLKTLKLDKYDEKWLDFIIACRGERDTSDYDAVIGGVADDRVFNTIELYFDGLIDKEEAIVRLAYEKPSLQIAFRTMRAIELLKFIGSESI